MSCKCFFNIIVDYNFYHQLKTTCTFFICKKNKKIAKRLYIYKNPDTFQKTKKLRYVFIHKNPDTLRYAIFHDFFKTGIYIYTKSMTICVT